MNFQGPIEFDAVDRIDYYTTLHKGLRRGLYEVSQKLAMANASHEREIIEVLDRLHGMLKLMGKLGGVEASRVHGFLEETYPGATQAASADSQRQTLAVGALLRLEKEIREAHPRNRRELLATLNGSFTAFLGESLLHMADAELEIMPLLRDTATLEELRILQREIYADLGREAIVAMVCEVLPAIGHAERIEFLQTLQRVAPSAVWPSVWWSVCALLSETEQKDFSRVLGVDCALMPLGQTF